MQPFHLAIPVTDLEAARSFYVDALGCGVGRESGRWIDFDLMGHQVTVHLRPEHPRPAPGDYDVTEVPIPHFGVVLEREQWDRLARRLQDAGCAFLVEPTVRYPGEHSEQATMFLQDPSGNALEFKSMRDPAQLFEA